MTVAPRLQPREATAPQLINVLHSPKRIRVKFGGRVIADSRNVLVLRSNRVVALPDKTPYIHYETDTEPGSSGSPAYNDQWEVIALHHAGVPELDANDNPVRDAQGRVKWVANEGIRVSRLMKAITELTLSGAQKELRGPSR